MNGLSLCNYDVSILVSKIPLLISHFLFFSQLDGYFFLTSLNVQINLRVSTTVRKSHAENRSALLTQKVVKQIAAYVKNQKKR